MAYPANWDVTEIDGEWASGVALVPRNVPGTDIFTECCDTFARVVVGSQLLAETTTLDDWTAANAQLLSEQFSACGGPETTEETTLGGEMAKLLTIHCTDGYFLLRVSTLHDGRGYLAAWRSSTGNEASDRATLEDFVSTFAFAN